MATITADGADTGIFRAQRRNLLRQVEIMGLDGNAGHRRIVASR